MIWVNYRQLQHISREFHLTKQPFQGGGFGGSFELAITENMTANTQDPLTNCNSHSMTGPHLPKKLSQKRSHSDRQLALRKRTIAVISQFQTY